VYSMPPYRHTAGHSEAVPSAEKESRKALTSKSLATRLIVLLVALLPMTAAADDERGEKLYDLCQQCHGGAGGGSEMALAPAIGGLDAWYVESQLKVFRSGARGTHPHDVAGMRMHPMSRWLSSEEDVKAVAGYVSGLPITNPVPVINGGDVTKGKAYYATCAACHGEQGKGNQTMSSPPLRGQSDWYVLSSLRKYKAGIRGANPANTNAVLMRGMSNLLPDDQAMIDVVAFIATLEN
jgi:cytochrome c oxidase subunit 2